MELFTNIPEYLKRLEALKLSISGSSQGGNNLPPTNDISDAMFGALNAGMGLMKKRIFNDSEDANGEALGNYHGIKTKLTKAKLSKTKYSIFGVSVAVDKDGEKQRKKGKAALNKVLKSSVGTTYTEYEKYRLSHGRQIDKKDLELEGALRRSIEVGKLDNKVVIAITNHELTKIANYQEKQIANIRAEQNANTGSATPVPVFKFSKAEFDYTKAEGNRLIRAVIKQKFEAL